jgi:hypothetical protein
MHRSLVVHTAVKGSHRLLPQHFWQLLPRIKVPQQQQRLLQHLWQQQQQLQEARSSQRHQLPQKQPTLQ